MPAWKLILAYDGGPYHGWQVQPGLSTVQGTLAAALFRLTGEQVLPQGSGRTDTGVHALAQVASFALAAPIPAASLERALNRALPASIRVLSAEIVPDRFHARHSALRKTYEYRVFGPPSAICPPFLAPYVFACPFALSHGKLEEAAREVLGTHDFTSFAATDPDRTQRAGAEAAAEPPSAVRTIDVSGWHAEPPLLVYTVTGSGFLHHMVRNLVGTFLDLARGLSGPSIAQILAARNRGAAGPTAAARGLFLHSVEYPR